MGCVECFSPHISLFVQKTLFDPNGYGLFFHLEVLKGIVVWQLIVPGCFISHIHDCSIHSSTNFQAPPNAIDFL